MVCVNSGLTEMSLRLHNRRQESEMSEVMERSLCMHVKEIRIETPDINYETDYSIVSLFTILAYCVLDVND